MLWRGLSEDALRILANWSPKVSSEENVIRAQTLEGVALMHLQRFPEANQLFSEADALCARNEYPTCGSVLRARGVLAIQQGRLADAHDLLLRSLFLARKHHDRMSEATAFLNLAAVSGQEDHYDDAVDWAGSADRAALALGNEDLAEAAHGNLGWAYFKLGDTDKALELFLEAKDSAARLGDNGDEIKWLTTAGYVYNDTGDPARAFQFYTQALQLATRFDSKEDIVNSLQDLAHVSIQTGKLDDAEAYLTQVNPFIHASGNRLDALDVMLVQGKIAAARHQDKQAETIFRAVENDPAAQTSMRLDAEHELALLYERHGNPSNADRMYRTALTSFESARDLLKKEDSKIPFVTNATDIYGDYIHFLVGQGKTDQALRIADQSRAQTLEQGLGLASHTNSIDSPYLKPIEVARKTNATLLFYWMGDRQSWLWIINSRKIALFPLPPQREIAQSVARYRRALLGIADPIEDSDPDGLALYRLLVAPAADLLPPGSNVIILSDGALSQLNFETLIVPAPRPHYWIEDATVVSAPSLHLLAAAAGMKQSAKGRLLLIGDAISPNIDYPQLPEAASEMKQIQQTVATQDETVYSREEATAAAYLDSDPQRFTYIHFVAHGVASRTDPLDSAIILSRSTAAEDSFKLHAREIIRHPIHARLVTISACYGSGTRSYAGEGPVGLAWAFLHAGAHNVIGALWEVSDESTPQMMGDLYQDLERGQSPGTALREAKLSLLHSHTTFRKPFYWAPFQLYTGL